VTPVNANSNDSVQIPREFNFIADERLRDAPMVWHLARFVEPVRIDERCQVILDRFHRDDALYALPVIDANKKPVALVERRRFVEFFSKLYTTEVFGNRNITYLLGHKRYESIAPIVVEDSCSIEDVAQIVISADLEHMITGIVVCNQGSYLGIANGRDLLNIMSQRKQAELYYLAHYDSLTGIPNRTLFRDRFEHACRDADRKGSMVGLLFIDVDRFKQINDSLGHNAGDAVLREVAARISASARRADTVARISGDEFVVLMHGVTNPADMNPVALRIVNSMREPMELALQGLVTTVSIGSAIYPRDDADISALLGKADAAMYEVKMSGGDAYRSYSSRTTMYNPESKIIESELRQAIERDELVLHFQPQVDLASRKIIGVEALVRWLHPVRGLLPPAQFISIAEESRLIVPLGEWVLRQAFRQLKSWREQGMSPLLVAINISPQQFRKRNLPEFLKTLLAEYDIDPALVELELTESALMQQFSGVQEMLQEIKALGVSIAIDDFGTGFSSLSYLRRFPIDRLKIDRTFVHDIELTPVNESICRAIVALANSLSLDVIAEGIEKASENSVLEQMGCRKGQGYLFARPLAADDIAGWLPRAETKCAEPWNSLPPPDRRPAANSLPWPSEIPI